MMQTVILFSEEIKGNRENLGRQRAAFLYITM